MQWQKKKEKKKKKKENSFIEVHAMNISQSHNFIPLITSEEMVFEYFFRNLASFGCQSNLDVWTKSIWLDHSTNISESFCQNICNEIAINANFHFSHYNSMETLICHSNQSV